MELSTLRVTPYKAPADNEDKSEENIENLGVIINELLDSKDHNEKSRITKPGEERRGHENFH